MTPSPGPAGACSPVVTLSHVTVSRPIADRQAVLAWIDGALAAVLVRLDDEGHGRFRGCWFVEIGFGALDVTPPPVFRTLEAAEAWIAAVATPTEQASPKPLAPALAAMLGLKSPPDIVGR